MTTTSPSSSLSSRSTPGSEAGRRVGTAAAAGPALRLPHCFDPAPLQREVRALPDDAWIPHFNRQDYEGDWSGIALRGPASAGHPIQALTSHPGERDFADQKALADCPAIREALAIFGCDLLSVRLLRLAPGARILEHTDPELGLAFDELRLHVPIMTGPDVEFRVDGSRLSMQPGELWYIDTSRPHSVANRSPDPRIHLVIDCVVDRWLSRLIKAGRREPPGGPR